MDKNPENTMSDAQAFLSGSGPILVSTPYPTWPVHWETSLELAQRFLDRGDNVIVLRCRGEMGSCDANLSNKKSVCRGCDRRQDIGIALLTGPVETSWIEEPSPRQFAFVQKCTETFSTLAEWTAWHVDGFDVGQAVHSSMASNWALRDHAPDVSNPQVKRSFQKLALAALVTFESTKELIEEKQIQRAVIFNGRFAITRAMIRACQQAKIPFATHERGPTLSRFGLWVNSLPHDVEATRQQVIALHGEIGIDEARIHSHRVYTNRRRGKFDSWHSFTEMQKEGNDDELKEEMRYRIVVFTTSQTEFVSLQEGWKSSLFDSQQDALRELIAMTKAVRKDYLIWIRMHPNQAGNVREIHEIESLATENVRIILPQSDVDSYAIMLASDLVVTFGSTTGIEAAYWRRPSILLGPSPYGGLGSTYEPRNLDELRDMLSTDLEALPIEGARMYGAYLQVSGLEFKYASEPSLGHAMFKKVSLTGTRDRYIKCFRDAFRRFRL